MRKIVLKRLALYFASGLVLLFLILPICIIVPSSFSDSQYLTFPPTGWSLQWYRRMFARPEWTTAFLNSVYIGSMCTLLSVLIGVPAAIALVRGRFPAKDLLYGLILSPMILPHVIIALGTYFFFAKIGLSGKALGVVLGHTVAVLPVVIVMVATTLQDMDPRLEQAAILFGASPAQAFVKVTLPLMGAGIVSASLFAFLLSFDELIIALFVNSPASITLPMMIWNETVYQISPTISAVSTMLILVTVAVLALSMGYRRLAAIKSVGKAR